MRNLLSNKLSKIAPLVVGTVVLMQFGCGQKETASAFDNPQSPTGFSASFGALDRLLKIPEYAEAKEYIDRKEWSKAEKLLRTLGDSHPEEASFANDLGFVLLQRDSLKAARDAFKRAITIDPQYDRAFYNLGICLSRLGDDGGAETAYKEALKINPFDYEAAFNLGLLAFRREDWTAARETFQHIVDNTRSSEFAEAHYQLGLIASREENFSEAVAAYEECILLKPDHVPSYINLGAAYLKIRLPAIAVEKMERALPLEPENLRLNWNLALAYGDLGKDQKAETILRGILARYPDHGPTYINLATIQMRENRLAEAKEHLLVAAQLLPKDSTVYWNLGQIATRTDQNEEAIQAYSRVVELQPDRAEAYLNLAVSLMRSDALGRAQYALRQAKALAPGDTRVIWNLGLLAVREKNDPEAIANFKAVLEKEPLNHEAALNLSAAFMRQEMWGEAIVVAQNALDEGASDYRHYWNLSLCYDAMGEFDKEETCLRQVLRLNQDHPEANFNLGLILYANQALEEAKDAFHRAAHSPQSAGSPKAFYMLGKCFSDMQNFNAAINAYESALRLQPTYPEASFNLALNLQKAGETQGAITVYEKLYKSHNATAEALNNLALYYLEEGRSEEALTILQKATQVDPAYATGWYNLGLIELRDDKLEAAQNAFLEAVQIDQDYFAAWKNLGIARARTEEYNGALEAMNKAFLLNPSDGDAAVYTVKYLKLLNRPEESITEIYKLAYDNGVRNPLLLRHLAKAASGENDAAAVLYYEEYLKLRPTAPYYYNLGLALRRLERFEDARSAYKQAVLLKPDFAKAWLNLGYIHAFLEEESLSREAFNKALSIDPDYENAKSALQDLNNNQIRP